MKVGSVCSGIEAASVAWDPLGAEFAWFAEIDTFLSKFLLSKYPLIPNHGDLCALPEKLLRSRISSPDMICGGTPCQAFSLSGWKRGLADERGLLTLKFIEAIDANDSIRGGGTIVFWENVEGVLSDKTNAFSCFVSGLAGSTEIVPITKWPTAGLVRGPKRNVAWRVLDAKYFGVPQQRRRLYVLAGDKDFAPEDILFEHHEKDGPSPQRPQLDFVKNGKRFHVFREYTDCLYSAYGTKWNGNAAAYNGSLFVEENGRLRRLSPLECERLMGFPDGYTDVPFAKLTNRYQGLGNSWAVPVVRWIGKRIFGHSELPSHSIPNADFSLFFKAEKFGDTEVFLFDTPAVCINAGYFINVSEKPEVSVPSSFADILDDNAPEQIFISPIGCRGILRRKEERGVRINPDLERVLSKIASEEVSEEIANRATRQHRGAFSLAFEQDREKRDQTPTDLLFALDEA